MTDKRYQVFISSTFKDLEEERRAVQDAIISMGDFPVQMESFPATDESQMDFIRPLIAQSDYYVLIIGGRYGTIDEDGLSFTHKEFKYAIEMGIPVLVMLHGRPETIAVAKSESTEVGKTKLREFITEAENKRIRKTWNTIDELKLRVREALDHAKRSKPRTGWVRGDSIASFDALEELNTVRKENEKFRETLGNLAVNIPLPNIPQAADLTALNLLPLILDQGYRGKKQGSSAKVQGSWISFFPLFFTNLYIRTNDWNGEYYWHINHEESCIQIGSAIAGELTWEDTAGLFKIARNTLERLVSYYTEVGLMNQSNLGETAFTEAAERIARRHRIAGVSSAFDVVEGEVTVGPAEDDHGRIPF
ncbi:DUF4062 domain-containing protein [Rhizobium leguminosarum]|uniref:DUF4062 domain-containing protein n=1 Tax=Rhizobium leguminosarum TaxID=384 RepID=UPI001C94D28B|nr:DUF4062 domain-containing protein [Rhizobium leguminosarum]MBY5447665.1 DUF4062 domain-containing protein [Rhizobium leguminosarum]